MRSLQVLLLGVSLLGASVVACGDDSSSSGSGGGGAGGAETGGGGGELGGSPADLATQHCEAKSASAELCGEAPVDLETCKTSAQTECVLTLVDPDKASAYFDCLATTCVARDCLDAEDLSSPEAIGFKEDCLAMAAQCNGSLAEELCYLGPVQTTFIADAAECLATEACTDVQQCIVEIYPEICWTADP